jgi:hypothetical protein
MVQGRQGLAGEPIVHLMAARIARTVLVSRSRAGSSLLVPISRWTKSSFTITAGARTKG